MEELMIFTVYEVSAHLRQVIESNIEELYVQGEVSNFVHHSSGHMYFNLKDDNATLRCTFFRPHNRSLNFSLEDGILTQGQTNAENYLLKFFTALGYKMVVFEH